MGSALRIAGGLLAAAAVPFIAVPSAGGSAPAALVPVVQVDFQMNEPPGATVMVDSNGSGITGAINPTGVQTGVVFNGSTGYNWVRRPPTDPPASPERVIVVPDNDALDPLGDTFTIEVRYRNKEKFGNIIQKGQARTVGGQWKIQNPKGQPSCLFKSATSQSATKSPIAFLDNQWHVLKCVRTSTRVEIWVDGVMLNKHNGTGGYINNKLEMTIGGKLYCDQITVTCDYFSGMIDYVKLSRGV